MPSLSYIFDFELNILRKKFAPIIDLLIESIFMTRIELSIIKYNLCSIKNKIIDHYNSIVK